MAAKRKYECYQDVLINKKIKRGKNDKLPENTCFFLCVFFFNIDFQMELRLI